MSEIIDLTKNSISNCNLRHIAPHHLEEHLLPSDVWPVGIWVKEFDPKYKRPKRNSRWR